MNKIAISSKKFIVHDPPLLTYVLLILVVYQRIEQLEQQQEPLSVRLFS